jgi:uncharacterized Ntn-hydrolase superfamily protein
MNKFTFLFIIIFFSGINYLSAQDTFSIVAIDTVTGEVGSAGASCYSDCTILTDIHPGWGVIHTQAYWLAANQNYGRLLMNKHYSPGQILDSLINHDAENNPTRRQYGIIDFAGGIIRDTAYTGVNCDNYKNHIIGPNYTIQGNILLGQQILDSMKARFLRQTGSLANKLMAALQGAKVIGADTRCASHGTSSLSAFIRVAKPWDTTGTLFLNLKVINAPVNRDPIDSLQVLYNNWLITNIRNLESDVPKNAMLYQNFPNPFNPNTNIKFSLINNAYVTLKVYNSLGKEVSVIVNEILKSGTYEVTFYADNLPSGVYYYRLNAGEFKDTKRMVILK